MIIIFYFLFLLLTILEEFYSSHALKFMETKLKVVKERIRGKLIRFIVFCAGVTVEDGEV